MMSKEINLNGRRLNRLQTLLFNRSSNFLYLMVYMPFIIILITLATLAMSAGAKENSELMALIIVAEIMTMASMSFMVNKMLFMDKKASGNMFGFDIDYVLKNSYFINKEMVEKLLCRMSYRKDELEYKILKNCSGHEIIEKCKIKAYQNIPEMINYMENISKERLANHIVCNTLRGEKCFKEPFTFKNRTFEELIYFYSMANNIRQGDTFAQKALSLKTKEELYKSLNDKLVEKV